VVKSIPKHRDFALYIKNRIWKAGVPKRRDPSNFDIAGRYAKHWKQVYLRYIKLGTFKRQRGFDYVLTRGKKNVLGEVSLVFIGYNLSRFIQITEGINSFKKMIEEIIALFLLKRAYLKAI
jgi:hypothetical protein